ncbi:HAD-IIB family hydrolase [Pseudohoeflea suaedae]|nr:HAD-IIB family hydrolase [Pseudohoeflea suaedae]
MIVFSDLDGTLLDHETYSFDAAKPALERLKSEGHVLVLASSKTAAEIAPLREAMGFAHCPAIVENGAGLLQAGESGETCDGSAHEAIRAALSDLPERLRSRFEGFSDWGIAEIARRTGLAPEQAEKAARRRFSEPGVWSGSDTELEEFVTRLSKSGITGVRGGRFFTLSHGSTKASRMEAVLAMYPDAGKVPKTVALGDAPNDVPMLENADLGIIIANRAHAGIGSLGSEVSGKIIRSVKFGPEGWNEEMLRVLDTR